LRVYTGNQWQDNALGSIGSFNPAAINTGTYCTLAAPNLSVTFGVSKQPYFSQFFFIATTFYVYANAGTSGGTIQPQVLFADGLFRDYGPVITLSSSGFVSTIIINTPVLGSQFNITSAVTGGSVFLEIDALRS
jgi:hypothetical protein